MSPALDAIDGYFADGSPLAAHLHGFAPRPEQQEMARLVSQAIDGGGHLAVEAGAGTGKTLAYLVPALLSGRRVIIATGTRTLQDQLYHRDLPLVSRSLGRPATVAQLKGRANYLCRHRAERTLAEPMRGALAADLRRIGRWALQTATGDIGEVAGVGEGSPAWPLVTSTADNCLGSHCPRLEDCHVAAARRRAAEADIAVVNHHLLLADLQLRDDGFGRLLPGADVVVVDEAHRFPETAQALFDVELRTRALDDLLKDTGAEAMQAGQWNAELQQRLGTLGEATRALVAAAGTQPDAVPMPAADAALGSALQALAETLTGLHGELAGTSEASAGLARCTERAAALAAAAGRIANWEEQADLCWYQADGGAVAVHLTPLDASALLRALLERQPSTWVFTSATLAVAGDFGHFTRRIGLAPLATHRIDSPFDYARCARLFLPEDLPAPETPDYTDRVVQAIEPVLQASRGRAFLLFTSRRALARAAQLLAARDTGHTLLVQGSVPRSRLLEQFASAPGAVLLGTATFWEGVDIRGPALVVVAIDRLPFAAPGDPFLQARLELVRRSGGDPFRDYQLPQAVLALRQGVGRLIRGCDDYGVVMIADPRLTTRGYGRVFLASLPPMPVVRKAAQACAFLTDWEQRQ
ncbi:MAG: ATP-dependent DNA helicase [Gammaproteobacteria bacterium]|nr:ATP-dependent DNA helicase [Gammaproteobacteria bacterium]